MVFPPQRGCNGDSTKQGGVRRQRCNGVSTKEREGERDAMVIPPKRWRTEMQWCFYQERKERGRGRGRGRGGESQREREMQWCNTSPRQRLWCFRHSFGSTMMQIGVCSTSSSKSLSKLDKKWLWGCHHCKPDRCNGVPTMGQESCNGENPPRKRRRRRWGWYCNHVPPKETGHYKCTLATILVEHEGCRDQHSRNPEMMSPSWTIS